MNRSLPRVLDAMEEESLYIEEDMVVLIATVAWRPMLQKGWCSKLWQEIPQAAYALPEFRLIFSWREMVTTRSKRVKEEEDVERTKRLIKEQEVVERTKRVKVEEDAERTEAEAAVTPVKCFQQYVEDVVSPYENLRRSRIAENQARMEALGVKGQAVGLSAFFKVTRTSSSTSKVAGARKPVNVALFTRRSERIRGCKSPDIWLDLDEDVLRKSKKYYTNRLTGVVSRINASSGSNNFKNLEISPVNMAHRCNNRGRGSLYDSIVGLCCHFCRQKKLCGEEECERCGFRDISKPCLGKTNCSKCNSVTGVFCRACLKIRYGEELEDVKRNPNWMCPHCFEAEGLDPYWICNSSICLTRRKLMPTGIAIFEARAQGFKSVAHYLHDKLEKKGGKAL